MKTETRKKLFGLLGALVLIFAVLSITAPTQMHAEQSIVINRPVGYVFNYLRSLRAGEQWSPWFKMDPDMKVEYRGPDRSVGGIVAWDGNKNVGSGEQEIKAIERNKRIDYELRFKKPMEGISTAYLATEAVEGGTKVTWGMDSPMPFPFNVFGFLMNCKGMIEKVYAEGLANLKTTLEK